MTRAIFLAAVMAAAAGCDKNQGPAPLMPPPAEAPPAPAPAPAAPKPPPPPPAPAPEPEADRITVQHVLIAFKGAHMAPANVTRTREEAKAFANEILERVRKGEDVTDLARRYSTDPGGGRYTLVNSGVQKSQPTDILRSQFIKPFTDVAFKLKVGEAGIAEYHERNCPYGWHVIKRLE